MANDLQDDLDYGEPGNGSVTIQGVPVRKIGATRRMVREALDGFYTMEDLRWMVVAGDHSVIINGLQEEDIPTVVDALRMVLDGTYPITSSDQPEQEVE